MKKLLALLMVVIMTASLFTVPAFAAGEYLYDEDVEGVDGVYYTDGNGSWVVLLQPSGTALTEKAATAMSSLSGSNHNVGGSGGVASKAAVYSIPLPEIPVGKIIKTAEFRMTSVYSNKEARAMSYSYKMPGEHNMDSLTVGEMHEYLDGNSIGKGEYYLAPVKTGTEYSGAPYYRNRYDVTDYVNECLAANQQNVWIAVTHGYTIKAYRHNVKDAEARIFYTLEDAPALTAESSSVENGATNVYPFGDISVSFSNTVKSASATINGAEVPASEIDVDGKTVSVSYDLALSQATELVINVKDIANQELSYTVNFTTADRYKYYNDSDMAGVDYTTGDGSWIMKYAISSSDTTTKLTDNAISSFGSSSNLNIGNAINAGVYKMKLPELKEGEKLSSAQFRISAWYSSMRYITHLYKMPGEAWDMSNMTIADAQKIIEVAPPAKGVNFLASCTSDKSYYDNGNTLRCKYEVTEYINECIEAGQEYVWFAATYQSTIKAYKHNAGGTNGARLYYTTEPVPVVKGAKLVSDDSEAAYADATDIAPTVGQDIKAICYLVNKTDADIDLNIGVAQYSDGELVGLNFGGYTLLAGTDASTVDFGASTVQKGVDEIKVFMWDADNDPVVVSKTINVK